MFASTDTGPLAQPLPPIHGGGMFGGGGGWQNALMAALAGFNARRNPQLAASMMNNLQEAQRYKRDRADKEADRQAAYQQQIDLYNYKLGHPEPPNNDTVNDYNFWKQTLPPDQFQTWLQNRIDPPQLMQVPGVGIVSIPRQAQPQAAPTAPVGKLTPYNGGPSLGGSGGFL